MRIEKTNLSSHEISLILAQEIDLHPRLEIVDILKLLMQAWSGPTHLTPDFEQVRSSISAELDLMQPGGVPHIQDIGCGRGFLRVDLAYLLQADNARQLDKEIDLLARQVILSRLNVEPTPKELSRDWSAALPAIQKLYPISSSEAGFANELISSGRLFSHSQSYKELYNPHYRVVHSSICNTSEKHLNQGEL
ncbi:MAG TPA: hypothetical protein PLA08_04980 [Candidatus Cloacimonadota bacterium]|nr:hypothetical protein [Candidatus Cloacimonadota bacterium]